VSTAVKLLSTNWTSLGWCQLITAASWQQLSTAVKQLSNYCQQAGQVWAEPLTTTDTIFIYCRYNKSYLHT